MSTPRWARTSSIGKPAPAPTADPARTTGEDALKIAVLLINFGEPAEPVLEEVTPFLERIFLQNADLEADRSARSRAAQLAAARAPQLVEAYRAIGGSPLDRQARAQAEALGRELAARDVDAQVQAVFQFTPPYIGEGVARACEGRADVLVGLPVYPMCGHSTTVAALDSVRAALDDLEWDVPFLAVAGWHRHPDYLALRVDHIRAFATERGLDLRDPDTILYFSAHGTPVKYITEGNRYDRYVEEHCRQIAEALGVGDRFAVGFQNHTNRRIAWTWPDNEERIRTLVERRLVVDAVSFIHEQSETLDELDRELRAEIEAMGKEMYRVPVPHDDPRFAGVLAALVGQALGQSWVADFSLSSCRCRPKPGTWCTNGARDLKPSPYIRPVPRPASDSGPAPDSGWESDSDPKSSLEHPEPNPGLKPGPGPAP